MKVKDIVENEQYFNTDTYKNYLKGIMAYKRGDYLAASVESAVFIEALLNDILKELDYFADVDLSGRIDRLRSCLKEKKEKKDKKEQNIQGGQDDQKKPDISDKDKDLYTDIVFRCNDIRNKRNRILHNNGVGRGDIAADTQDIYKNSLLHLIKDYVKTDVAAQIKEKNVRESEKKKTITSGDFRIFISTITPHTFEQEMFIEYFRKRLQETGAIPVRCVLDEYDMDDPITKVRDDISKCNAVVIIGLNRTHSYLYVEKEGANVTDEEGKPIKSREGTHRYFSSAWLQLEGGIAAGLGKEIFVLCQKEICSEGIFDRYCYSYKPIEIDSLDINSPKVGRFFKRIKEYMQKTTQTEG